MKYLTTLLMIVFFANFSQAQSNNYQILWEEVKQLEKKGLPKSALKVVDQIANIAENEKNSNQKVKVLIYKSKFALTLEENAQLQIINDYKTEIEASEFPHKNILESQLATLYWQYFQQNRYKFYNRTKTSEKVDETDFRTWDLQTLFSEIQLHYANSLQNGLLAQQTPLENFDILLDTQKGSKKYRPTLFDFLSHQALIFFKVDEHSITKPAYKFEIDQTQYFSDASTFSRLDISSEDETSLQLQALKIYQSLLKFHLKSGNLYALSEVNLERLKYVDEHSTLDTNEALLLQSFVSERATVKDHEVSALYDFEIASVYNRQANQFEPKTNEENRWKRKEALELCNSVLKNFPKSKGAEKCTTLIHQIQQKSLTITSEKFVSPNTPSRVLVQYKNINALEFEVFSINRKQLKKLKKLYKKEEQYAFIKKLALYKQWETTLKNEGDYQTHSTEVLVPNLINGSYIILASTNEEQDRSFAFSSIQITRMALVEKRDKNFHTYQIINRENGNPIANAAIKLSYLKKYNGRTYTERLTTNTKGEAKLATDNKYYRDVSLEISKGDEIAYFDNLYIQKTSPEPKKETSYRTFLFTDRSIYRPGQTVYFKGIIIEHKDEKTSVVANQKVFVTLNDVNYSEVKELELTTNEYGSVSGEFIVPSGVLTGNFTMEVDADLNNFYGSHSFSVEEYKRPKFETKFEPVTKTFQVNDSVTIQGNALAYAGSTISDAKVVYRVKRNVQYPSWFYWYRPWFHSEPQEITHGESMTNEKGEFEIVFKALPDESVSKENLPIFNYEISADVTDINGETRSATTLVNVGYHTLLATIQGSNTFDKLDKKNTLQIDSKNLNGEYAAAKGSIKIYKLEAPQQVLRTRPWNAPDYQEISEEEFKNLFPHDAYNNEDEIKNWNKGTLVFSETFDTEYSKEIALGKMKRWESGKYIIELESKDRYNQAVKDIKYIDVYGLNDETLSDQQLFNLQTNKTQYAIGETVTLTFASATKLSVTVDVEKDNQIVNTYVLQLDNNTKSISIPVEDGDLGGFIVHYSFAAFNSHKGGNQFIKVPYPASDLQIETVTFRDKLQPGEEETWSFKVKGPKGDQVNAELLASMYDASLDQFTYHDWSFHPISNPDYRSYQWGNLNDASKSFGTKAFKSHVFSHPYPSITHQGFDSFNWFGLHFGNKHGLRRSNRKMSSNTIQYDDVEASPMLEEEVVVTAQGIKKEKKVLGYAVSDVSVDERINGLAGSLEADKSERILINGKVGLEEKPSFNDVIIRKNLNETAFFFPMLRTDSEGNVSFSFTSPEALTKWKLQLLAHTKTLESTTTSLEMVTQKELMVIPNAPRFLREGDQIQISTKISNLSEKQLQGVAVLQLFDALTGKSIDQELSNAYNELGFTVESKGNTSVFWNLDIPEGMQAVQYKVIAKAGDFSDGEQNVLPVLSNRMLVTETLPMWVRSNQTKTFSLDKLKNNTSTTLKHHQLTLEMTSNPAWYAVQALPYLMEYPYECNEQTFSRFYANALASHIANSNPRIQEVFNQWKNTDALVSNLEKNQELKSLLIQETPWLRDAQSESEQKKRIALLFDLNKMNNELSNAQRKLQQNQLSNGAWSWFNGGRGNRYITQHIITGFGHLKQLKVETSEENNQMIAKAIQFLDAEFVQEYKDLKKYRNDVDLDKDHLSYTQLHYLYMRSFFSEVKASKEVETIQNYYIGQIEKYWLSRSLYAKGLMALVMHRNQKDNVAKGILKSLKENSITSEELGMYWKENTNSWFWYQAPIETQALLIEAFSEINNDIETIDNLKIWLLKNKQTNQWKTTKSTTEAVYALLLQGSDWLSVTEMVDVIIGNKTIDPSKLDAVKVEAGTGYYKTSWKNKEVSSEMADVQISKKGDGIAWGALYWQYFEDLDKITSAETPLTLKKELFLKKNTDVGEEITAITKDTEIKVGDLVRVRIELTSDRAMEFVHMKDMRAAGFEPVNVISKYKWQDGLGYYESTKDASTNFFFDYLPKGIYVFEYDVRVNNAGDFSNGITTIQSMYAPEFSSHSEGVRVKIQ